MLSYGLQSIDKKDIRLVTNSLKGKWLTTGPYVAKFEKIFASFVKSKYAVCVSNATAGLHLAVLSLNLKKGSEGITSPITFVASSNAMIYGGLKPKFTDINLKTFNIDPKKITKDITKKTKLFIPVHFGGQPCDMKKIKEI